MLILSLEQPQNCSTPGKIQSIVHFTPGDKIGDYSDVKRQHHLFFSERIGGKDTRKNASSLADGRIFLMCLTIATEESNSTINRQVLSEDMF